MFQMNAVDKDGIPRVFGHGPTLDIAETECRRAIVEYCKGKPHHAVSDFELVVPFSAQCNR